MPGQLIRQIRNGVALLAVLAALAMLERGRSFFVPLAFGVFLAMCLQPLVARLARVGCPQQLGAAAVLIAFVGIVLAGVLSLQDDTDRLLRELPDSALHFRRMLRDFAADRSGWWQRLSLVARNAGATGPADPGGARLPIAVSPDGLGTVLLHGSLNAASLLSQFVMVLLLAYFLLIMRMPRLRGRHVLPAEALQQVAAQIRRFVLVMTLTNLLLGLLTWLAFTLLGVAHAAVWGVAAAVLHLIPYAGPAAFALAAALAALVQFGSWSQVLLVAGTSILLATLVGVVLTSWLSGHMLGINKAAVFVGLLFWAWLWGLPGFVLGVPMTMLVKIVADRMPALEGLYRLLDEDDAVSRQKWRRKETPAPSGDQS